MPKSRQALCIVKEKVVPRMITVVHKSFGFVCFKYAQSHQMDNFFNLHPYPTQELSYIFIQYCVWYIPCNYGSCAVLTEN